MKKTVKAILIMAMLLSSLMVLAGCGDKKEDAKKEDSNKAQSSNSIVGTWTYELGGYTYHFNEDGTGDYSYSTTKMEFTYKTEGNMLSIMYKNSTAPLELEYSIDGDTLNVIDSFGNDTLYKRQK